MKKKIRTRKEREPPVLSQPKSAQHFSEDGRATWRCESPDIKVLNNAGRKEEHKDAKRSKNGERQRRAEVGVKKSVQLE